MTDKNQVAAAEVEPCKCGTVLARRPRNLMTPEQAWCGQWFDHPIGEGGLEMLCGHTCTVLIQSPALIAQLAAS